MSLYLFLDHFWQIDFLALNFANWLQIVRHADLALRRWQNIPYLLQTLGTLGVLEYFFVDEFDFVCKARLRGGDCVQVHWGQTQRRIKLFLVAPHPVQFARRNFFLKFLLQGKRIRLTRRLIPRCPQWRGQEAIRRRQEVASLRRRITKQTFKATCVFNRALRAQRLKYIWRTCLEVRLR
jgi:hypothetical protein